MYSLGTDRLVPIHDLPPCDTGAPLPQVVASEGALHLVYITFEADREWDGSYAVMIDSKTPQLPIAVMSFQHPLTHMFSAVPDEETMCGHPLATLGLEPYSPVEVLSSSWISSLESIRSVAARHWQERFTDKRHFIFGFHDSTFECVAAGYTVTIERGSISGILARLCSAPTHR